MFSFVRGIFLLCLLVSHSSLLIGVKGETCGAGEGLQTSGSTRTSGKCNAILTANECHAIAYKAQEDFDTLNNNYFPPGCYVDILQGFQDYTYNKMTTSTVSCGALSTYCVCSKKTCQPCATGYYSLGGDDVTCIRCPLDKPYTYASDGKTVITGAASRSSCAAAPTCSAGEEGQKTNQLIRSSGTCSKYILNEEECKKVANADNSNNGYDDSYFKKDIGSSTSPPGCVALPDGRYSYNPNTKSTTGCMVGLKCVCDVTTCVACSPGYYSPGGNGVKCIKCPLDKPFTTYHDGTTSGATSISMCTVTGTCDPGWGVSDPRIRTSGKCTNYVLDETECKNIASADTSRRGYNGIFDQDGMAPSGCWLYTGAWMKQIINGKTYTLNKNQYWFNPSSKSTVSCGQPFTNADCVCDAKPCAVCRPGYYSPGGTGIACKKCKSGKYNNQTGSLSINDCMTCIPGTYSSKDGSKCIDCAANHYTTDGITCTPCDDEKVSPPRSTKPTDCKDLTKMLTRIGNIFDQQGGIIKAIALSNAKSNEVKQKANGLVAKLSLDWATQDVINEAQKLRNQLATLPEYNVKHHCEQEKQRLAYGVLRAGVIVPSDAEIDDKYCLNENRNRLISSFCNFRPRFIKLLQEKLYPRLPSLPKYTGRDLWPNICCKKDNFQNLKTCNDPSGKVPRSHIVPFALAQGGNLTVENLYGEIVDILKLNGYLQQGMNKAVNGIKDGDKIQQKVNNLFETTLLCGPREFGLPTNEAIRLCELFYPYEHMLGTYYDEVNVLLDILQRRRRRRMLGVWSGITNLISSASAFVFGGGDEADNNDQADMIRKLQDEMEMLKKKDAVSRKKIMHLEKKDAVLEKKDAVLEKKDAIIQKQANKTNTFLSTLKRNGVSKRRLGSTSDALCPFVTMSDVSEYEKDIDTFCTGYAHIDLNYPGTVINLAIMTPWDIPPKMIPELREKARYEISDDCPTPMFTANDISLQNIDGTDLFVVQLDATSHNGYLRKELPQCGAANNAVLKPHIPKTTIDVKIWRDHEDCCKDTKDYRVCKAIKCLPTDDPNGIEPVKDAWTGLQVGYHYKVIGTTYTATCDNKPNSKPCGSNARRRSLLQDEYGNSGERL